MISKMGISKTLIGALAIALSSGLAHADENKLTRQEGAGMFGGAAVGAVVGGPVGAVVGLMIGGILGDSVGTAQRAERQAQQLEQDLLDARIELANASQHTGGDEMLDALAERLRADVMFRSASADMDQQVAGRLEDLGKLLAAHSQLEVELHGFADPRGTPGENLELSLRRADAVREALIKGGALPGQIRLAAHGEDLTTASKDDLEAYAWERRVSLSIRPATTVAVARSQ